MRCTFAASKELDMSATEVIFLRVPSETKAIILAQVEGMNKARQIGEPEYTLQSFVLRCVNDALVIPTEKPASKRSASKGKRK